MKKKVLGAVIGIILIVGSIIVATKGFNHGLEYQANEKVELYVGKVVEQKDIEQIAKKAFAGQKSVVQIVEVFSDMASVTVSQSNDDQIEKFVSLINEKYGTSFTKDNVEVLKGSAIRLKDISKPYLLPVALAAVILTLYLAIRYHKLGFWKVCGKTIGILVLVEALLASVYAIVRLPINELTMPICMSAFVITAFALTLGYDKKAKQMHPKEEEE